MQQELVPSEKRFAWGNDDFGVQLYRLFTLAARPEIRNDPWMCQGGVDVYNLPCSHRECLWHILALTLPPIQLPTLLKWDSDSHSLDREGDLPDQCQNIVNRGTARELSGKIHDVILICQSA
jgi:hypothetical protein